MQTETSIVVEGLEKSFKKLKVIKGIDFSVKKGTIFALLGSNGAGKTTTIKILSTLLKPDKGIVKICNFDVVHQAHYVRQQISLTGQYASVDSLMTGRENLNMIGKLRHLNNVKEKTNELLNRFSLIDEADRRVATYSGGMIRRLDLAMSLMGNPSIIFLDEPTTGLDPQNRIGMWKIIKELANTGVTVFLTTQYLEEAEQLANQIVILDEGKIVARGTTNQLKKLLPNKYIEIGFNHLEQIQNAYELLKDYNIVMSKNNMTLRVATDGGIKEISSIINLLENANISIASFEQKLPTLEDVFLTIIGESQKGEIEL